ncbi:MAG: hypothetical protein LBL21_04700 [Rickettsiales bacterium]|jgi:hypothetical protein|nr:hypothetical protein [Rickettsiales bacterium]
MNKKAIDIYNDLTGRGIDPMRRFVGPEYEVLIPLSGLDRFEYDPAYGADYRRLGIYEESYGLNPQAYVIASTLNRLGHELGLRFRITDAWRPIDTQIEKFILNKIKNPDSTLFAPPFGKAFEWTVEDGDFLLEFYDGERVREFRANANDAKTLAGELANDGVISKYLRPTPHAVGGAMDMLPLDGRGNPLTQPKWLANKIRQDIDFAGWDFDKIADPFVLSMRAELEQLKGSDKEITALIGKKLAEKIEPMEHEALKSKNPMFTTHMRASNGAPEYLKNTIANVDYLVKMADSIPNFIRTNDENWHFQCTDVRQYGLLTIDRVKRMSKSHIARVKKECDDFAAQIYPVAYDRKIRKGAEIVLFKGVHFHNSVEFPTKDFTHSDLNFNERNLMTHSDLKNRLAIIAARQGGNVI